MSKLLGKAKNAGKADLSEYIHGTLGGKSKGIGIRNIEAKVEKLGGDITFDTSVGKGTSVMIEVPL